MKWRRRHQLTSIGPLLNTETCFEMISHRQNWIVAQSQEHLDKHERTAFSAAPEFWLNGVGKTHLLFDSDKTRRWEGALLRFQKIFGKLPGVSLGRSVAETCSRRAAGICISDALLRYEIRIQFETHSTNKCTNNCNNKKGGVNRIRLLSGFKHTLFRLGGRLRCLGAANVRRFNVVLKCPPSA